jgi:hypothetical protein
VNAATTCNRQTGTNADTGILSGKNKAVPCLTTQYLLGKDTPLTLLGNGLKPCLMTPTLLCYYFRKEKSRTMPYYTLLTGKRHATDITGKWLKALLNDAHSSVLLFPQRTKPYHALLDTTYWEKTRH